MKKFTISCDFGGQKHPFQVYVGEPDDELHPLYFQQQWLTNERGGNIPPDVMESFQKLHNIAKENNVSFEELCMYAFGQATDEKGSDVSNEKETDSR